MACASASDGGANGGSDGGRPDSRSVFADAPLDRPDAFAPSFDAGQFVDSRPMSDARQSSDGACGARWTNLLRNGGFDSGASPWLESSGLGIPLIVGPSELPLPAPSPQNAAWLAGYNDAFDHLSQTVAVPANAQALRITGRLCFGTEEGDGEYDFLTLELLNTSASVMEYLIWSNLDADLGPCGWREFTVDTVTSHAGENVTLYLEAVTDPDFNVTTFMFDSLSFEALTYSGC